MKTTIFCTTIGWLVIMLPGPFTRLQAQDIEPVEVSSEQSPAWSALAAELEKAVQALRAAPAYGVEVKSQWTFTGQGGEAGGNHVLSLHSASQNRMRLEVREENAAQPQFVIAFQKPDLIRWSASENKYSKVETDDARLELQTCGLTRKILEACEVEFLLMPHPRESILARISQIADLGNDQGLHHFELSLNNGHHVNVWLNIESSLPQKIRSQFRLTSGAQQPEEALVETTLEWALDLDPQTLDFAFSRPKDAIQVADLYETIHGHGVEDLEGKPLPELSLVNLQNQPVKAATEGKATLLYFWATWAAPSTEAMPSVIEFAESLKARNVKVLAVNVAEDPDRVRQFLELNHYSGEVVVDRNGSAVDALRLLHLPAVVLVRPDGTVDSIMQNVDSQVRELIARQLDDMQLSK
jgi:thiol-disulfide isomerase/thioredoxin